MAPRRPYQCRSSGEQRRERARCLLAASVSSRTSAPTYSVQYFYSRLFSPRVVTSQSLRVRESRVFASEADGSVIIAMARQRRKHRAQRERKRERQTELSLFFLSFFFSFASTLLRLLHFPREMRGGWLSERVRFPAAATACVSVRQTHTFHPPN